MRVTQQRQQQKSVEKFRTFQNDSQKTGHRVSASSSLERLRAEAVNIQKKRMLVSSSLTSSELRLKAAKSTRKQLLAESSRLEEYRASFRQHQEVMSNHTERYQHAKKSLGEFENSQNSRSDPSGQTRFLDCSRDFICRVENFATKFESAKSKVNKKLEQLIQANKQIQLQCKEKDDRLEDLANTLSSMSIVLEESKDGLAKTRAKLDAATAEAKSLVHALRESRQIEADLAQESDTVENEISRLGLVKSKLAEKDAENKESTTLVATRQNEVEQSENHNATLSDSLASVDSQISKAHKTLSEEEAATEKTLRCTKLEERKTSTLDSSLANREKLVHSLKTFHVLILKEKKMRETANSALVRLNNHKVQLNECENREKMHAEDVLSFDLRENETVEALKNEVIERMSRLLLDAKARFTALQTSCSTTNQDNIDSPTSYVEEKANGDAELKALIDTLQDVENQYSHVNLSCHKRRDQFIRKVNDLKIMVQSRQNEYEKLVVEINGMEQERRLQLTREEQRGGGSSIVVEKPKENWTRFESQIQKDGGNIVNRSISFHQQESLNYSSKNISRKTKAQKGGFLKPTISETAMSSNWRRRRRKTSKAGLWNDSAQSMSSLAPIRFDDSAPCAKMPAQNKRKHRVSPIRQHQLGSNVMESDPFAFSCAESEEDLFSPSMPSDQSQGLKKINVARLKKKRIKSANCKSSGRHIASPLAEEQNGILKPRHINRKKKLSKKRRHRTKN